MTGIRNIQTLTMLKDRALDAMTGMARWKRLPHALSGFILLARAAGWEEKRIQDTWAAGTHPPAIEEILKSFEVAAKKKNKGGPHLVYPARRLIFHQVASPSRRPARHPSEMARMPQPCRASPGQAGLAPRR